MLVIMKPQKESEAALACSEIHDPVGGDRGRHPEHPGPKDLITVVDPDVTR